MSNYTKIREVIAGVVASRDWNSLPFLTVGDATIAALKSAGFEVKRTSPGVPTGHTKPGRITYCDSECTAHTCSEAHERRDVVAKIDCGD